MEKDGGIKGVRNLERGGREERRDRRTERGGGD